MIFPTGKLLLTAILSTVFIAQPVIADELSEAVEKDYQQHLGTLFEYFHRNPELSFLETKTAARLAKELRAAGFEVNEGIGAEDFPFFTTEPYIPSTYFAVGGTPQADFDAEKAGGTPVPSHHSPLFKVKGEESVRLGVEATVLALRDLLQVIAR